MKRIILFFFFTISVVALRSQEMPTVMPPAPEAASLGKYADMPVSYASGLPQINIPMFSASNRDISVPVSLSYHAGGIRVEEIASRVGLGWNLQAGGSVTRSVRGVADDGASGWLNNPNKVADFKNAPFDQQGILDRQTMLQDALGYAEDFEPDVFNFSYPGGGGKFYLKPSGEVMLVPNTEHKVEYVLGGSGIESFTITDPSGYKYYFGEYFGNESVARDDASVTTSFTDINDGQPTSLPQSKSTSHVTSWHLLAITSPISTAEVVFTYITHTPKSVSRASQTQLEVSSGSCSPPLFTNTYVYTEYTEQVLNSIIFENGFIQFVYDTSERLDLPGSYGLEKVILKDTDGNQVRAFELNHDYFNSSNTTASPISGISVNHFQKRLKLLDVEETGTVGSTPKVYDLDYNTLNLPHRLSTGQDAWGFYNGKNSNPSLIPTRFTQDAVVHPTSGTNSYYLPIEAADRRTDVFYAQANVLKKVTYPTGGSAGFTYESNGAYLADNQTRFANTYFQTQTETKVDYSFTNGDATHFEQSFIVDDNDLSGTLHFTYTTSGCAPDSNTGGVTACGLSVQLVGINGTTYSRYLDLVNDAYFNVAPGNYKLVIDTESNQDPYELDAATATLSSFTNASPYSERSEFSVGGLRILRTILDNSNDGPGNKIIREYSYVTDINTASGFLENNQWLFYDENLSYCSNGPSATAIMTSHSAANSMGTGGAHIGYTAVREAQLPGDTDLTGTPPSGTAYPNGYTSYQFDYALSEPNQSYAAGTDPSYELIFGSASVRPSSSEFPYAPFKHKTWQRGNMLSSSAYKNTGVYTELVNRQENIYSQSDCLGDVMYDAIEAIKMDQRGEVGVWAFYEVITGNNHVINSTTTTVQGNGVITESTNYAYTNHFLRPDKTTSSHSDGQKTITKMKYTDDAFGAELSTQEKAVLTSMVADNILAPVLTETFIDTEATPDSKSLTVFGNPAAGYLPTSLRIWNREKSIYEERLVYEYSSNGNYEVIVKDGAQRMAYIWNYYETLPTAQVANADRHDDIAYSSFEANGKGNWSYGGDPVAGTDLPSGQKYYDLGDGNITKNNLISTEKYIISFWAKSGTVNINSAVVVSGSSSDWEYHQTVVTGSALVTLQGTAELDELRLYPHDAQMTTYTYDPHRGVTTMGSANNLFTYYQYDAFGRLYKILDHEHKLVKLVEYSYNQSID